jgi:hypothetical protein
MIQQLLGLAGDMGRDRFSTRDLDHPHRLLGIEARTERRGWFAFSRCEPERLHVDLSRRRRHEGELETTGKSVAGEARPERPQPLQCLLERLREVHFVEQHEHVVADKTGMHRPHSRTDTIALYQEPRAQLVDRRRDHERLVWCPRPTVVLRNPASQREHAQWFLVGTGQRGERIPHRNHLWFG